jgi:putative ABC transport system permease protein
MSYLATEEVERIEPFMEGFAYWDKPTGGMELCVVIGARLGPDSLGAIKQLTHDHRSLLTELGSVVVDQGEFGRLGITKVGDTAEVAGRRVRVVGTVSGLKSLAGPYVFCSIETAKMLLRPPHDQVTFLLAKCYRKEDAPKVVAKLQAYPRKIAAFTAEEFSLRSRLHWLLKTKAGIALGLAALLGLLVGAVVTSQTLYAATVSQLKEYAVLRAMGIPRWRMGLSVLAQSFWVGLTGIALSMPLIFLLAHFGNELGAKVLLPWWLLTGAAVVTMTMALLSGLWALRSLRLVEPINLLR